MPIKPTYEELEQRIRELENADKSISRLFEELLEHSTDYLYFKDKDHRFIAASNSFANLTNHNDWRDLRGKNDHDIFPIQDAEIYYESDLSVMTEGACLLNRREPYQRSEGDQGWVDTHKWPIKDENGSVIGLFGISRDITELVRAEEALKKLEGIIPMCMHCKEIRDEKGSWNQLEKYISEHSEAHFSHGICEKCLNKYYPDETE